MGNEKTILELREIYSCLVLSNNIAAKAFMSFILSSGMNRNHAMDLTIGDLLSACNADSISFLLKRNPDNIVPIWVNETEDEFKLNFSSPESLFYIFLHLKERLHKSTLSTTDKLFDIAPSTLDDNFRISRHLTEIGSYNPFSNRGECVSHDFAAKTLQRFFVNQYLKYSPDYDNGKQRKYRGESYSEYKVKLITLFTKGLPKGDEYYKKFSDNPRRLLLDYKKVLPCITAKNYDVIRPSWNEPSDFEIRFNAKVDKLMKSGKKSFTDLDVSRVVIDYAKFKSKEDVDILQIIDFAVEDNKIGYFEDSTLYLDNLLKKPSLKKDLNDIINEDIELHPLSHEPAIREIISNLDNFDIFEKYDIDKNILTYNIINYLDGIEDEGKPMYLSANDLLELCFGSQMNKY